MQKLRNCTLEFDDQRGVLYVHNNETDGTVLRICGLPLKPPDLTQPGEMLDITCQTSQPTIFNWGTPPRHFWTKERVKKYLPQVRVDNNGSVHTLQVVPSTSGEHALILMPEHTKIVSCLYTWDQLATSLNTHTPLPYSSPTADDSDYTP